MLTICGVISEWLFILCAASCSLARISLASLRKITPAGVSETARVERFRSFVSNSSSKDCICLDMAEVVMLRASAAPAKLKPSATLIKLSSCWVVIKSAPFCVAIISVC